MFLDNCQHWKSRNTSGKLCDIYDGAVWRNFQEVSAKLFLVATSPSLASMLNVDWFQPFKHTVHSVGVIYLTILNLPWSLQYKRQTVVLLGLIPRPSEPKHNINTFLDPLVDELARYWTSIYLDIDVCKGSAVVKEVVRCALLCCACDLPAGRKVCGFLGHSASLDCSKCLKAYSGSAGNMNYSGFDHSSWAPITNQMHRQM